MSHDDRQCGLVSTSPRLLGGTFASTTPRPGDVRDFVPLWDGDASIYVCGLTVQSEPHVGHVRSVVNFDVLQRWLEHRGL